MLEELFAVSKYPYLNSNQQFSRKLITIFKVYLVLFAAILFTAPVTLAADKLVINIFHHKSLRQQNSVTFQHLYNKLGFVKSFIFICIIGPAFEETIFRLWLSFKKQHVAISLLVALFYFGAIFFHIKNVLLRLGFEIGIAAIITGGCLLFLSKTYFQISDINKKRLIILSISLFGLMHVFNYLPFDYPLVWLYPLYVIPQLLMGWGISYMRFKDGFVWGIVLHCLINTVSFLLSRYL